MPRPLDGLIPALLATLLLGGPTPSFASGRLTGLSASPDPGAVNQSVVFTLQGTGDECIEIALDYGDGLRDSLKLVRFDRGVGVSSPPHAYKTAGTYTVTATAARECEGSARIDFTVNGGPSATGLPPGSARDTAFGARGLTESGSSTGTGGRDRGAPPRDSDSSPSTGRGRPYEEPGGSPPPRENPSPFTRSSSFAGGSGFKGATGSPPRSPGPTGGAKGVGVKPYEEIGSHPDDPTPRAAPHIDGVFPFSVISPGGGVIVTGSGFGSGPGQFRMQFANHPMSYLGDLSWADGAVGGTIDPDLAGLADQEVALYLVAASGAPSNIIRVRFTARREMILLPPGEVDTTCGRESDVNECGFPEASWSPPPTFTGRHGCTGAFDPYFGCNDSGKDSFYTGFTLRNGWRVDHADLNVYRGRANFSEGLSTETSPGGTIAWDTLEVTSLYSVYLYLSGPAGTPYK